MTIQQTVPVTEAEKDHPPVAKTPQVKGEAVKNKPCSRCSSYSKCRLASGQQVAPSAGTEVQQKPAV